MLVALQYSVAWAWLYPMPIHVEPRKQDTLGYYISIRRPTLDFGVASFSNSCLETVVGMKGAERRDILCSNFFPLVIHFLVPHILLFYIYIYIYIYMNTYTCMHIYGNGYTYVRAYTYIHLAVYTYIHTYILFILIQKFRRFKTLVMLLVIFFNIHILSVTSFVHIYYSLRGNNLSLLHLYIRDILRPCAAIIIYKQFLPKHFTVYAVLRFNAMLIFCLLSETRLM
jgi:hypothetical protein